MSIEIWFDGLCQPTNPDGTGTYGYIIRQGNKILKKDCQVVGSGKGMTNNVAEYCGLLSAFKWLIKESQIDLSKEEVIVKGDSKLVISQLDGSFKIKSKTSKEFAPKICELINGLNVKFEWIPREENEEADMLSKIAYNRFVMGKNNQSKINSN